MRHRLGKPDFNQSSLASVALFAHWRNWQRTLQTGELTPASGLEPICIAQAGIFSQVANIFSGSYREQQTSAEPRTIVLNVTAPPNYTIVKGKKQCGLIGDDAAQIMDLNAGMHH